MPKTGIICLLVALSLSGCSTPSWLCYFPPGPHTVTLLTTPKTNGGSAVTVDLVLATDPAAARRLQSLSAQDYFAQRQQLERDFPSGIVIQSWGLSPGQLARDMPVTATCNRTATVLFARYASPGDHRQVLETPSKLTLSLDEFDFSVLP